MYVGISTASFYPELTEKALCLCGEMGVKTTEIFVNSSSEISKNFVAELRRIKDAYAMDVVAVHPFTCAIEGYLLFSSYKRRFEDGMDLYLRYAQAAAELGAKYVILHGDRAPVPTVDAEEYTHRFLQIDEAMMSLGINLVQENVNLYRSAEPDFIRQMRRYSGDRVKFVFDVKQSVRSGHTPSQIIDAMGEKIVHVHVSDHSRSGDCLLPGKGECDFSGLFRELERYGYQGKYVIEVYRNAYENADELANSSDFLNKIYTAAEFI